MGGDNAPGEIIAGALQARRQLGIEITLVGDERRIRTYLPAQVTDSGVHIHHCSEVIAMDENPSAIRTKRDASIVVTASLVKNGEADAMISAGSTAAAMAVATLRLGRIPGIDRPAIAALLPNPTGQSIVLDAGANADCTVENLLQFAVMGSIYAERVMGKAHPKVGLLSIGEEPCKGNELTKRTHEALKQMPINFIGNIEGRHLFTDTADVVVCDGFVGNVALKSSEGLAEFILALLRQEVGTKLWTRIPLAMLAPALRRMKRRVDYAEYGGAPLLGVNGVCIICHGRSNAKAISNAVRAAAEAVSGDVIGSIRSSLSEQTVGERIKTA
jgi:glycerol-3-phosphate acyltransferase PlsX